MIFRTHPSWGCRAVAVLMALCFHTITFPDARAEKALSRTENGIQFIAFFPVSEVIDGVATTPAKSAMTRMVQAVETALEKVPMVRDRIADLKKKGDIQVFYDASHPKDVMSTVTLASYLPAHYNPAAGKRKFIIVFGRTGIQWDANHLASTIAHELAGHAYQDMEGRLEGMTLLDIECEAYLIEEQAKQDLGYDKLTDDAIALRRRMDSYWCDDFRRYTLEKGLKVSAQWDELNPDVPKLLKAFRAYQNAK
ncbi:MAG: hypothetical protein P1V34_05320 [Alphaproteobacteria bacterium]|nr:hypothetical protein [Alphaproteobacteria bacterium]